MKRKYGIAAAALAAFFMLPIFSVSAYAGGDDSESAAIIETAAEDTPEAEVPVTDYPKTPPLPFTPSGTATVIDNATDEDGKEFYTITTPDEHIFYLVIDRQRSAENVYFLNAVTIADLAALAEVPLPQAPGETVTPAPGTESPETPAEAPPPEEAPQNSNNMGMYIIIGILVIVGGGAGWYFKIYRPKQQGTQGGNEYDPSMDDSENNYPGAWGEDGQDETDDSPPWDEDSENDGE